ncbi:hypothetical protein [Phenylobacterium montanum]|uniref:Uncharacterized protein n=1 Tax=Phenylobacterium montanum TaxID=2823693 RepID=A0A975IX22_9CAUL|nr:hypothetical protein [Caulobacter sp. S6]QUD90179.1 hypothetical protein KCG34_10080 [Caulobacter sp. S6]
MRGARDLWRSKRRRNNPGETSDKLTFAPDFRPAPRIKSTDIVDGSVIVREGRILKLDAGRLADQEAKLINWHLTGA